MTKGYPRSRFEIIDQTNIQEIEQGAVSNPIPLAMAAYTSDKGPEEWRLVRSLSDFTKQTGPISFTKHGQSQLTIAEELRAGAYVFSKRMVSKDAALANTTVCAKVVKSDGVNYVYFYTTSAVNVTLFDEACAAGRGEFDPETAIEKGANGNDIVTIDEFPLFTVAPMGRGASNMFFHIKPEYTSSRGAAYIKYSFEVYENNEVIESIVFTMNPDIIIDGVSQAMNPKVKALSTQVRVNLYEDGLYAFLKKLVPDDESERVITLNGSPLTLADIVNVDFIGGYDRRGSAKLGGIVTSGDSSNSEDLWTTNMPSGLIPYDLSTDLIPLANGTYGTMTASPMDQPAEYEKMLNEVFGGDIVAANNSQDGITDADVRPTALFDPVIYDLDAYKLDFICDCAYPVSVKNNIINLVDFRQDMVFIADLGLDVNSISTISSVVLGNGSTISGLTPSRFTAIYHNHFRVYDPYTSKQIHVTMPYLLASRMVSHIVGGCGRPFAGMLHSITFPEIIDGSLNFLPVDVPGHDQKQALVDMNVNYISFYDGTPVMETMYVNSEDHTQLSYLHNIMAVQEVIKVLRARCPKTRYTFLDGSDLKNYIDDATAIINQYSTNFKSIYMKYMADEVYEANNIFYATIVVQFKNFIQEEYFKVIAIS